MRWHQANNDDCNGLSQVISAREAVRELKQFLENFDETAKSAIKLPFPKGNLVVSDVTYQQGENEKKILDFLSFSLSPGNVCAVLGESGAGKSSLARMLVGYTKPSKGTVRLDGVSVNTRDKKELRSRWLFTPRPATFRRKYNRKYNKISECERGGIREGL